MTALGVIGRALPILAFAVIAALYVIRAGLSPRSTRRRLIGLRHHAYRPEDRRRVWISVASAGALYVVVVSLIVTAVALHR